MSTSLTFPERPVDAHFQRLVQIARIHGNDSLGSDADGDVVEERLRQVLLHRQHVVFAEIRADESNAAVDVEPDAA